jgi:hypothetical protein
MAERNLKDELFACHMYIKIPYEALMKMPVMDRKYYIHKYNEYMTARENAMNNTSSTTDINMYTNMSQGVTGDDVYE